MVKPLDERQLSTLPMTGGSLSLRFESLEDLTNQRRRFLSQMGLFVRTAIYPRPFCEFNLTLYLPDTILLETLPARLVQIVPYGDEPGLMIQLLRLSPKFLERVDSWIENEGKRPAPKPPEPPPPPRVEEVLDLDVSLPDFEFTPIEEDPTLEWSTNPSGSSSGSFETVNGDSPGAGFEDLDLSFNACDEVDLSLNSGEHRMVTAEELEAPAEPDNELASTEAEVEPEPPPVPRLEQADAPPPPSWQIFSAGSSRVAMLEKLRSMNPNERARLAKQANHTVRSMLIRDTESTVLYFLLQNPQITRREVLEISKLNTLDYHTVQSILANPQWAASEELRYNLVRNPKTPLPTALKLVHNLDMKNLRELAKDWGMKTPIKQLALRLVVQRGGS